MFNHVMIGTNDIARAKAFYEKVLGVLGDVKVFENEAGTGHRRVFFAHDGNTLALSEPINDEPATCANGFTIGFKCSSPEQLNALHEAAIAAGGTAAEDPPGLRQTAMGAINLCYFRDLDGHKICGIHRP